MSGDAVSLGVVDNLVTQFGAALDCIRELVQNSLDAGTSRVEVWTEFTAGDGHVGTIAIHVDDYGEGMDSAIIDGQLTRLFASTKENDLTKIGKFGIGFVSVFALQPKAVLVHTGRAGEYWEILFHEDRSFTKTRVDEPVEGTQVTLFLEGDLHGYRERVAGVRATLARWCSHSETEVTFEDRSPPAGHSPRVEVVNEPFDVPGDCTTRHSVEGTEMVLAYSDAPSYGFYNRGLTLAFSTVPEQVFAEARARGYARVALRVKSRHLEHTLSRDTVLRDESYDRVMAMLDEVRQGALFEALALALEALVARPAWGLTEMDRYARLAGYLFHEPEACLARLGGRAILRGVHGEGHSPSEVDDAQRRDGRIFFAEHPTELTRRVRAQGAPVLLGPPPTAEAGGQGLRATDRSHPLALAPVLVARLLTMRRLASAGARARTVLGDVLDALADGTGRLVRRDVAGEVAASMADPADVFLPVQLDRETPPACRTLVEGAGRCLAMVRAGYGALRTFTPDPTAPDVPLFVTARKLDSLMARPPDRIAQIARRLEAAINRDDPRFEALLRLEGRSPALARYCLAKALLLADDRRIELDVDLMEAALRP